MSADTSDLSNQEGAWESYMKKAGRALRAGVLVLAGAGILMLAGAGTAHAQPASSSVCKKLTATLSSLNKTFEAHPTTPKPRPPLSPLR